MHPNPIFHDRSADWNLTFARERAFGLLAVNGASGPMLSHVPFALSDDGQRAELHLVRSNPIARALTEPTECTIAVSGGDSYVSPDWYGIPDQVPTWNYVAVHLKGVLERRPQEELRDLLDRQSALFEHRLAPKKPWTTDKMSADIMEKMMRQIVPFRMQIASVNGTWKLNQNKPDTVRLAAADEIETKGLGAGLQDLVELMRSVPKTHPT